MLKKTTAPRRSITNRHALQSTLLERAITDAKFRKALVDSPEKTVAAELGTKLDPSFKVRVIVEKQGEMVLVLPETVDLVREFTDAELADVCSSSGDATCSNSTGCSTAGAKCTNVGSGCSFDCCLTVNTPITLSPVTKLGQPIWRPHPASEARRRGFTLKR